MKTTNKTLDLTLLIVRLFLAIVIGAHGAQKLLGWFGGYGFDGTMGFFTTVIGLPYFLAFLIVIAESLGMIALLFGFLSRILSASLVLIMLGAISLSHFDHGFFMNWFGTQAGEGFEFHLLVIALSFVVVLNGAGAYSFDRWLAGKFLGTKEGSAKPSFS